MSKIKALAMREGFWHSETKPQLPKPRAQDKPWKGKGEFLKALSKVQTKASSNNYKGHSECRLCGENNGCSEYKHRGWVWPEGYAHYIREHNVRPSLAFHEFILGREVGTEA